MGILDKLFGKKSQLEDHKPPVSEETPPMPKVKKPKVAAAPKKTEKELATEAGEPYVNIIAVELDPANIGNGAFELDWNDKFIVQLVKAGYQTKPNESEHIIVDRWFRTVCQNVVLENFEQEIADPEKRALVQRDLGNGRTEIS